MNWSKSRIVHGPDSASADPPTKSVRGLGSPVGPLAELRVVCGGLLLLAVVLAITAENPAVALTALGVTGLVPLAVGMMARTWGRRDPTANLHNDRDENAAIVMAVVALCWQPVVLVGGLREQIFLVSPVTVSAGVAAVALATYTCARLQSPADPAR